ncbi:MAG: hypothetical protein K6F95_01080 [Selenomonas sp.]|uniref:hypothetical protein n=1 Tax=Selenomonas sp. TaxID=2053611 RepID=UPI0025DA9B73|nr:hypothetical protein [Selenomonas sp.]MCR5756485.1 hypothetical protein [Selenomonas sp.]
METRPEKIDWTRKKAPSRWSSGICSICGVWGNMITQDHAKAHGFKNADEMAKAGIVKSNNKMG